MFPYGNKTCFPNNKEAGGFELSCGNDPPRPDPKDYRRGRKRKHRTPYREIPDHPDADALHRVFHVLRAWHRLWTDCRLSGHNLLA